MMFPTLTAPGPAARTRRTNNRPQLTRAGATVAPATLEVTPRTLLVSQLPVEHWHDVVVDATFADASLERLLNNVHRITASGSPGRQDMPWESNGHRR